MPAPTWRCAFRHPVTPPSIALKTRRRWRRRGWSRGRVRHPGAYPAAARRPQYRHAPKPAQRTAASGCPTRPGAAALPVRCTACGGPAGRPTQAAAARPAAHFCPPGGGHDLFPVTDSHTTAQPPGQHIGVGGGRLAQLCQRRILFKDNFPFAIGKNFQRVARMDALGTAYLLRDDHPAQFIDAPHNSCRSHTESSLVFYGSICGFIQNM